MPQPYWDLTCDLLRFSRSTICIEFDRQRLLQRQTNDERISMGYIWLNQGLINRPGWKNKIIKQGHGHQNRRQKKTNQDEIKRTKQNPHQPKIEVEVDRFLCIFFDDGVIGHQHDRDRHPDRQHRKSKETEAMADGGQEFALITVVARVHGLPPKNDIVPILAPRPSSGSGFQLGGQFMLDSAED